MKRVKTRTCEIIFHEEEGFLRVSVLPEVEMNLEDARSDFEAARILANNTPLPILSDPRQLKSSTHEVRSFYASKELAENILAMAVLVDSLAIKMVVNFFIKFHKPHFPTRMFNKEAEALAWLKQYIRKQDVYSHSG